MDMAAASTAECIVSESSMVPTDMEWCLRAEAAGFVEVAGSVEAVDSAAVAGPRVAAVAVAVKS
jgi:hypothetical protein